MSTIQGYGVDRNTVQFHSNFSFILYDDIVENNSFLKQFYDEFVEQHGKQYEGDFGALLDAFFDSYENNMYGWWGVEAVINDYIDEQAFGNRELLRYEDECWYVDSRDALEAGVATDEISAKLSEYLGRLCEGDIKVNWYDIHFE